MDISTCNWTYRVRALIHIDEAKSECQDHSRWRAQQSQSTPKHATKYSKQSFCIMILFEKCSTQFLLLLHNSKTAVFLLMITNCKLNNMYFLYYIIRAFSWCTQAAPLVLLSSGSSDPLPLQLHKKCIKIVKLHKLLFS